MNVAAKPDFFAERAPRGAGPLVTVAISLYDYAGEIESCLRSVKAQSHPRLEVIVVDDASTDLSASVALRWLEQNADRFERASLWRQSPNMGLSAARNLAFGAAAADYVFVLDADNTLYPGAISRLLERLEDEKAAVAYSQLVYFGDMATGLGVGGVWCADGFKAANYVDAMALVRKSAWAAVGGYSPLDYGWEDYDFWCKFIEAGLEGVFVPELLCRYRVHANSMRMTDTIAENTRLVHAMMAAHPWLELRV